MQSEHYRPVIELNNPRGSETCDKDYRRRPEQGVVVGEDQSHRLRERVQVLLHASFLNGHIPQAEMTIQLTDQTKHSFTFELYQNSKFITA